MELYSVPFHPNNSHIHCLAHVVNLVVQKMLSVVKNVDDPELQDYYECLNQQVPVLRTRPRCSVARLERLPQH